MLSLKHGDPVSALMLISTSFCLNSFMAFCFSCILTCCWCFYERTWSIEYIFICLPNVAGLEVILLAAGPASHIGFSFWKFRLFWKLSPAVLASWCRICLMEFGYLMGSLICSMLFLPLTITLADISVAQLPPSTRLGPSCSSGKVDCWVWSISMNSLSLGMSADCISCCLAGSPKMLRRGFWSPAGSGLKLESWISFIYLTVRWFGFYLFGTVTWSSLPRGEILAPAAEFAKVGGSWATWAPLKACRASDYLSKRLANYFEHFELSPSAKLYFERVTLNSLLGLWKVGARQDAYCWGVEGP